MRQILKSIRASCWEVPLLGTHHADTSRQHVVMTSRPTHHPTSPRPPLSRELAWALALPGPHREVTLSPWPRKYEVRGSIYTGYTTSNRGCKNRRQSRLSGAQDGGYDGSASKPLITLDAFELRVLERPTPTIDLSALHVDIASLRPTR
ncbi:hypothetical protein H5410_015668 [Solanum commersonii]|uniref:Uncharacterized protein n=1 Tax=Solanum commersonii TaxID=4109 RepID=A0A9J5ZV36_SOLCO|nr:hypothetical protein H5410_015668 [Solanum commersonii]